MKLMDRARVGVTGGRYTGYEGITIGGGRIFTIYPIMAKDLDDISQFINSKSHIEKETQYRAATVCLVNQKFSMFPYTVYKITYILNENAERLVFSLIRILNMGRNVAKEEDVDR